MREERLAILNMVSEGKITAEEGAKLLEAICKNDDHDAGFADVQSGGANGFAHSQDDLGGEIRNKVRNIYKEAEPSLRKTILSALETAVFVSDTVHNSLREELKKEMSAE